MVEQPGIHNKISGALTGTVTRLPGAEPSEATTGRPQWTGLDPSTEDGVTIKQAAGRQGTSHWQQITSAHCIYTSHELTMGSVSQETKSIVLGGYFGGMGLHRDSQASKK